MFFIYVMTLEPLRLKFVVLNTVMYTQFFISMTVIISRKTNRTTDIKQFL